MSEGTTDPQALLAELEGAFGTYDQARVRLHEACSAAARGLVAMGERLAKAEAELDAARKGHMQSGAEIARERDDAVMKVAVLEGEVAALKQAHDKVTTESAESSAANKSYNVKIGELEGTVAALTEHVTKLSQERDAHGQHAAAAEAALLDARAEIAKRPGIDYLAALEKEKLRLDEELALARVEQEKLKRELEEARAARAKKTSSSTRLPAAAPPPVPEAKGFAEVAPRPAEKPPGALNVDELLQRARAVKKPG